MWLWDLVQTALNLLAIVLVIVVLWSIAFGHNRRHLSSMTGRIRYLLNTNNRREFVRIFDTDCDYDDEEIRLLIQSQVQQKLATFASLVVASQTDLKEFGPNRDLESFDSQLGLNHLLASIKAHKARFWEAHQVAKSCGFSVQASFEDYCQFPDNFQDHEKISRIRSD